MLAETIRITYPPLIRISLEHSPSLHQLQPMLLCLLQRHGHHASLNLVPNHCHQLSRKRRPLPSGRLQTRVVGHPIKDELRNRRRYVFGVAAAQLAECVLHPPVLLLGGHVSGVDDAREGVHKPESNEPAVARLCLILELKGRDPVVEDVGKGEQPALLCLDTAVILEARTFTGGAAGAEPGAVYLLHPREIVLLNIKVVLLIGSSLHAELKVAGCDVLRVQVVQGCGDNMLIHLALDVPATWRKTRLLWGELDRRHLDNDLQVIEPFTQRVARLDPVLPRLEFWSFRLGGLPDLLPCDLPACSGPALAIRVLLFSVVIRVV